MGLDMYLKKHIYIGANYEHNEVTGRISLKRKGIPMKIELKKVTEIIQEAAYWRKANQIHQWFVVNCQNGVDDCGEYDVSIEKLKELYDLCVRVKKNPDLAEQLLPTQGGFFFGSTNYGENYMFDIDTTITALGPIIREHFNEDGIKKPASERPVLTSFVYHASW